MTTEGTFSGFQDFFLQPIIKDWPKKKVVSPVGFAAVFGAAGFSPTEAMQGKRIKIITSNLRVYFLVKGPDVRKKSIKKIQTFSFLPIS